MTQLRKRFINELKLRNRSARTIQSYVGWIYQLAKYYRVSPERLSIEQIRAFLGYLAGDRGLSASTLNVALNAIVFLYREVLGWDVKEAFQSIKRPKRNKSLPKVYSREEVYRILGDEWMCPIKARLFLMTVYSAGLRVSEACALKCKHIEWDRQCLRIEHGKGGNDRILPLSPILGEALKKYCLATGAVEQSAIFLSRKGGPIQPGCARNYYNNALKRSGVVRRGGIHCLRHSYATHQLERGVDINNLRVLLGHKSIQTTMIYLQVSQSRSQAWGSPLDDLFAFKSPTPQC